MIVDWKAYKAHDWVTPWLDDAYEWYQKKFGKDKDAEKRWKLVEALLSAGDYTRVPLTAGAITVLANACPSPGDALNDITYANTKKNAIKPPPASTPAPPPPDKVTTYSMWTLTALNVRSSPSDQSDVMRTLVKGTKVRFWEGKQGNTQSPMTTGADSWVALVGGGWVAAKHQGQQLLGGEPPPALAKKDLREDKSVAAGGGSGGGGAVAVGLLLGAWLLKSALKPNPARRPARRRHMSRGRGR